MDTSVELMCKKILDEAQTEADNAVKKASMMASQRLKLAEQEANSKAAKIIKQAEAESGHIRKKILSSVAVEIQRMSLEKTGAFINQVLRAIDESLQQFAQSKEYVPFLKSAIMEAVVALNSKKASVSIGQNDNLSVIKGMIPEIEKELDRKYSLKTALTINNQRHSETGVIVTDTDHHVRINNTLEQRLAIQENEIRKLLHERLFGEGDNRG
ncbi:MAG: hypothetical protein C4541_09890 [Candidatus Auribacter fodinae]|jgi:vacuolar-type H+-ATPase subunit E/Vma4|uniref:V-type ATP synthase subunit E n=1 Tax=Candidatus Auribacter fodinae TaxID=2093366 RepID=A0A3A4QUY4_9BACT|nr:MAG: hypothetical protein C4541_09890 [Candidatus Auribacter fodinae]